MNQNIEAGRQEMGEFLAALFCAAGMESQAGRRVAEALIEADLSGRGSHGVLQADGYLGRLVAGTMSPASCPRIVSQSCGAVVLDAADMEGHLAAEEATRIAISKAREFAIACVAVRRSFHCGVTGRYVRMAAQEGCAALAMCNAKPIMAAPGGAERLVGTNPIAIGFPVEGEPPVVLDMATSTGTIGAIRQRLAAGQELPADWALDAEGNATTDPASALEGFLTPAGGAKGFGLSFVIDLLSGALASGGWGPTLGEMTGETPYNASFLLIALDIARFRPLEAFMKETRAGVERVRGSKKAQGTERLFVPGERSAADLAANRETISLARPIARALRTRAARLGVPVPAQLEA